MTNKISTDEMFRHIKEECVKDPLYVTKILTGALWKNVGAMLLRIAAYVIVYYVLNLLGVDRVASMFIVFACIVLYYTAKSVFGKIKSNIGESDGHKGNVH